MFESLSDKLQGVFKRLRGKGTLSADDVDVALREVRLALLEADVNFKVVKDFVARVKERAVGEHILEGLNPAQQVVKVVHEEMIRLLGGEEAQAARLQMAPRPPTVLMLCGLQGAGKTTLAGKLAVHLRKQGRNPLLAACDVQRPAAIKQLQVVGEQVQTPVFTIPNADPVRIAREAVAWAQANGGDVVILDTAGRLHVDDALMRELKQVKEATQPSDILLVLDAMTGQDAVNVARDFDEAVGVGGFVLTKIDGDARGGAAISIRSVVGKPIKFLGVGEKMDALELFHPDRMAGRILGMGDVLSLIEKAESALDEKSALEMEKKLRAGKFDFEDYLEQIQQMRRLGPLDQILKMLPGFAGNKALADLQIDDRIISQREAIIRSMTKKERRDPTLLNGSRRKRIATGSGTTVQEVNRLLTEYDQMRGMMRKMMAGDMPAMGPMAGAGRGAAAKSKKNKKGKGGGGGGGGRFRLPFGR
uniref:Signal recognition particle protein n=1 Tax=uncultured Armatimonadetes bacterium TaxID=157466 RepID=A0A6J4K127_9BACT|nr:Signal recognition particle protein Ffh [uncultured Armatimonadetes bacterium]